MKKLLLMFAAAGMLFTACNKKGDNDITESNPDFIENDYIKELVGTWTSLEDNGIGEAMVIKEDGSFTITGMVKDGSLRKLEGTLSVVSNKITLAIKDSYTLEGRLELVAGASMSIILRDEFDIRATYHYCKEDLSDEIIGMWICNDSWTNDVAIQTYTNEGKTSASAMGSSGLIVNQATDYQVVGDILFRKIHNATNNKDEDKWTAELLTYTPSGTSLGDLMTHKVYTHTEDGILANIGSYLRIKQPLELAGNGYSYSKSFVSNVEGMDQDISILNTSFNFAKMNDSTIDKFFKSTFVSIEFPKADSVKYTYEYNQEKKTFGAPIEVAGNKMTVKMSKVDAVYQDIDVYVFQDQNNTQMHLYTPTASFEKLFASISITEMLSNGKLDKNDADAVASVYNNIAAAIESIDLSLVMTKQEKQ